MFLKTHPLRGYIPPPFPMNHSPPTTLSPAILSLKTPPHFHHHLPLDWCTHSYPATSNRRRDSRNRTSQSSGIRLMLLKIRVTSTLGRQRHCCCPQTRHSRLYSPTPLTGLIVMLVPCLNSSREFILVSGFRFEIRTPSLAFLL